MTDLTAVEIFAGGGGLAVGLKRAGIRPVAAIEMEPHAAATFRANHPGVHVYEADVRTISGDELLERTGGSLDILAACPPCQGFSSLTSKWRRHDQRNDLVAEVARLAEELLPTAIMVENVPGLVGKGRPLFDDLLARLERLGYICTWSVFQVANFGVPQFRRRLVLFAGLGFQIALPRPTHGPVQVAGLQKWRTVRDAIEEMSEPILFADSRPKRGEGCNSRARKPVSNRSPLCRLLARPCSLKLNVGRTRRRGR